MKDLKWIKILFTYRKWLLSGAFGLLFFCIGFGIILIESNIKLTVFLSSFLIIIIGIMLIIVCTKKIFYTTVAVVCNEKNKSPKNFNEIKDFLYVRKKLDNGPKVVAIGGGTGISTMLRGLKTITSNVTAIITVADDGGSSGKLREELGILPPGDIRNCILALADTEPVMEKLLQYRFKEGAFKDHNFGNLLLAAMNDISDSFEDAVQATSDVLKVTGKVLPVTSEKISLCAQMDDGHVVCGEKNIGTHNKTQFGKIRRVYLDKRYVKPVNEVLDAIKEADIIVLGPGSLYTSIIPNLLVDNVVKEIKKSKAIKVYVCNVMTQPSETEDYSVYDHIRAIEEHSCKGIIEYCIVNSAFVPDYMLEKYREEGAEIVQIDYDMLKNQDIKIITGDFIEISNEYVRHNPIKLANKIFEVYKMEDE